MKKTSTNKSISGKYYWWAQTAPMEVLTRKTRKTRNQLPKIKDAFHMLRDSAACLFLSELIKGKYDFGGVLYNMPPDVFFPETKKNDLVFSSLPNQRLSIWQLKSGSGLRTILFPEYRRQCH